MSETASREIMFTNKKKGQEASGPKNKAFKTIFKHYVIWQTAVWNCFFFLSNEFLGLQF